MERCTKPGFDFERTNLVEGLTDSMGTALNRLAQYEDAEEQGLLVWLPESRKGLIWDDEQRNTVLCPCCERDLTGGYEDDRNGAWYLMSQCPHCGQPIDDTYTVTREEAEKALEEANRNG